VLRLLRAGKPLRALQCAWALAHAGIKAALDSHGTAMTGAAATLTPRIDPATSNTCLQKD
jgi:hypothetical protein